MYNNMNKLIGKARTDVLRKLETAEFRLEQYMIKFKSKDDKIRSTNDVYGDSNKDGLELLINKTKSHISEYKAMLRKQ